MGLGIKIIIINQQHQHHHQQSTINNQHPFAQPTQIIQIHELRPPVDTNINHCIFRTGLRHSVGSRTSTVPEASCKVLSFTKRPLAGTSHAAYRCISISVATYQQRRVSSLNMASWFWGQKDFVHVLGVVMYWMWMSLREDVKALYVRKGIICII